MAYAAWRSFAAHENLGFALLSVAWVMLLYGRALGAPFVYDDLDQVVSNPNLAPWHVFAQRFLLAPVAFTNDLRGIGGSTYRPLYWLSLALDRRVWGLHPAGFHATNLALHLANGFAGFRLLRRLQISLLAAAGASLLWLGLPINVEVVAWISGRSYSLCALFVLLSLLIATRSNRRGPALHAIFYFCASLGALLSQELGLLVLPLTLLVLWVDVPRVGLSWKRLLPMVVASLSADLTYVGLKAFVGAHTAGGPAALGSFALEFWRYVDWIVLPLRMSVERSTSMPVDRLSFAEAGAWVGFAVLGGLCFALRRSSPAAAAGIAWMTVGLLPFCGLVFLYQGMAERFTYIASAGLAFAMVGLSSRFKGLARGVFVVCMVAWMAWGGWRAHRRVEDWRDPAALYRSSLEANPESPSLNDNLAFALRQRGDLDGAERAYRRTIELQRSYPHALTSLGELYLQMGRYDEAERQFVQAVVIDANDSSAYTNMGVLFSRQNRANDAARMFRRAIERNGRDATAYFNLAVLLQQAGHDDVALPLYRKVLELRPGDADALANIALLHGTP